MIYKFTIAPRGAVGTPFRSDTLFGHACWALRLNESADKFKSFLNNASEQNPELVFSDGFPHGWFPKPLIPVKNIDIKDYSNNKVLSKRSLVNKSIAEKCNWDIDNIYKETISLINEQHDYYDRPLEKPLLRNVIDRTTGTSLAVNGLYSTDQFWYDGIWEKIDIYVSTLWDQAKLCSFIETMFSIGYGRDQTVGLGAVDIIDKPVVISFPENNGNWYLSLSHAVPCNNIDLKESFYQIETKYGKVWSGLENSKSPFKKVIIQSIPGSVFKLNSKSATAGRVLKNVHDNSDVIENCMTILYPLPQTAIKGAVV